MKQGEITRALGCYRKALQLFVLTVGKIHTSTATAYANIAGVYVRQNNTTQVIAVTNFYGPLVSPSFFAVGPLQP